MPRIGIIAALPAEAASLCGRRIGFDQVVRLPGGHALLVSGTGPEWARRAAGRLAEEGVEALASWGCAAALAPHLKPGALIVPERIRAADGSVHPADSAWRSRFIAALQPGLPVAAGDIVESQAIVADPLAKQALHGPETVAVDMESAAIARCAASHGLPFLAVRAVADDAGMALPAAVLHALDSRGDVALPKLLGYSVQNPRQFIELARLGRAFGSAMSTLRRVRNLAGNDFRLPPEPAGGDSSNPSR